METLLANLESSVNNTDKKDVVIKECIYNLNTRVKTIEDTPPPPFQLPYKVYTALLTQVDDNAPTALILQNTLNEIPEFIYDDVGQYRIVTDGSVFTANKTIVFISNSQQSSSLIDYFIESEVRININTFTTVDGVALENNILNNTTIEIRVYN